MAKRNYQKPPNGQAQSGTYLLVFDLDDPGQATAWRQAQKLTSQRKLKHVLVGLLLAVHTVEQQTGRTLDLLSFISSFIAGLVHGGSSFGGMHITETTDPDALPSMFAGTEDHADPVQARDNFSAGMGNLFDDDDHDLWD